MKEIEAIYNNLFNEWEYGRYLQAVLIFVSFYLALVFVRFLIEKSLKKAVKKTPFDFDDLIVSLLDSFGVVFYFIVSLFAASLVLDIGNQVDLWLKRLISVAVAYYAVKALNTIIRYFFKKYSAASLENSQDPTALKVLSAVIQIFIWVLAVLLILQNFGYNISTLLGGLGIVGIAVAFSLQNVLEDIFSFFTIYFDKPFKVGDFIVIGKDSGTVKKIGIKSTRVKTPQGQELIISNKELTGVRVNNYKRMKTRQVKFEFGVTYETSGEKLEKIPEILAEIIGKIELSKHKRTHFRKFGESALIFETVFTIEDSSFEKYVDIRQLINLEVVKRFEKEKIKFAYPTQTVFLRK
ncbi:mechanosensitive ion channel family protein [Candidatus Dojkabacteria bacterium]|nr:mechanosensitive ion channel family protein [Candidatus Dojkabacteria bacterium]